MKLGSSKGFTLIELMIVVAIIGILAAIAYPSYDNYRKKVRRVEVQAEMLNIASQLQKYKVINGTYRPANISIKLDAIGYTVNDSGIFFFPSNQAGTYKISLQDVTNNGWLIVAMTENAQKGDGSLGLDHNGYRCWSKGSDLGRCTPNSATKWD